MEIFYDKQKVTPVLHEIMRANTLCVKSTGRAVPFGKGNKNYNPMLKRTPVTPLIDVAIARSRHVMIAAKAVKEMWGLPSTRGNIRGTSLEDNIIELEHVLSSCDIFVTSDLVLMHKDYHPFQG
jgi:hypothetical protein